jgi:hypothetical protein
MFNYAIRHAGIWGGDRELHVHLVLVLGGGAQGMDVCLL